LNLAGEFLRLKGDYDRARTVYEESLALCRASGNRLREAYAVGNLGSVFQYQGNHKQAGKLFKRALVLASEHSANFVNGIGIALLSGPVASQGDPLRAAQLLGASDSLLKAMGLDPNPSDQLEIDRYEAAVREQLSEEDFESAWAKGQAMSLEQANAFALEEKTENG
jgi:non-specific serine/threonine protein kinase